MGASASTASCGAGAAFLAAAEGGHPVDLAFQLADDMSLLKHASLLNGNTAWHVAARSNRPDVLKVMIRCVG